MTELKTRFFKATYENGALRRIMHNDIELIRMIYSAVRDRNWGTVEPVIVSENISEDENGFTIEVKALYRLDPIHFEALFTIKGWENRLKFKMEGESKSTFLSNRTGICVLHPIGECSGKECLVIHPDGTSITAVFPVFVSPRQPMKNIAEMEWKPAGDVKAKLRFSGDIFEMEDQRNWTDASYKTYCRPLNLPFPYEIKAGEKIMQQVDLEIKTARPGEEQENSEIHFQFDESRKSKMPEIGLSCTSRKEPLTRHEAQVLKEFPFGHLRAEFKLFLPGWETLWVRAADESNLLNVPLFVVLYFSDNAVAELAALKRSLSHRHVYVKYVLVVGEDHLSDDARFESVFDSLKSVFPQALIGQGVNANFAELNRNRPMSVRSDFISFGICPQVHATDDTTLVENLEAQRYAVESAREIFPAKPLFVSPVTLKQRFNVVATSQETELAKDVIPSQVDLRQPLVFTAQWMLGSIKYLSQCQTELITYFETAGWRGFLQGDFDPPGNGKFPAEKGDIFPAFKLILELKDFDEVLYSQSSSPLLLDGMALRNSFTGEIKIILTNYSSGMKRINLTGRQVNYKCSVLFRQSDCNIEENHLMVPPEEVVILYLQNEKQ